MLLIEPSSQYHGEAWFENTHRRRRILSQAFNSASILITTIWGETLLFLHLTGGQCFYITQFLLINTPARTPKIHLFFFPFPVRLFNFLLDLVSSLVWMNSFHFSHEPPSEVTPHSVLYMCVCKSVHKQGGGVTYTLNEALWGCLLLVTSLTAINNPTHTHTTSCYTCSHKQLWPFLDRIFTLSSPRSRSNWV